MNVLIISLIMTFTTLMLFLTHPLSMGLMIILQTMLICLIMGLLTKTYWFSYILFLTFLGGMLIMFIYTTSIASNETFKINMLNNFFKLLFFLIFSILLTSIIVKNNYLINSYDMMSNMNDFYFFNNENKLNLLKLYNNQTYMMTMMVMTYLLITLVSIVKIINNIFGPLRMI